MQEKFMYLKRDRNLFCTLYIACQVRDTDLEDFFWHENRSFPPSLSDDGNIRFGSKSDVLLCLEHLVPTTDETNNSPLDVDMIVTDGTAREHQHDQARCFKNFQ